MIQRSTQERIRSAGALFGPAVEISYNLKSVGKERLMSRMVDDIRRLFGPPPILTTESAQAYEEVLSQLVEHFKPRTIVTNLLIKHVADTFFEVARYSRHKTLGIEREFR